MSPTTTDFIVTVVSPLPPKFAPPVSCTVNGFALAHAASFATPSSVGAEAAVAATSVFGVSGVVAVEQAASASAAAESTKGILDFIQCLQGGGCGTRY